MLSVVGRTGVRMARRTPLPRVVSLYSTLPDKPSQPSTPAGGEPIPPAPIHRVTYEYPPPPKRSPAPVQSSPWRRHVPLLIGVGGLLWASYAFYYFFGEGGSKEQTILTPTSFTTYRITCKENMTDDTALIELSPKFAAGSAMLKSGATLWNGKRLWSIQVKNPMVQIVRNYTPLPLYFMQSGGAGEKPLLRVMGAAGDEGRLCLLVKRYDDGEMSRYLHSLPVGSDVEIRGPFVEHQFAYDAADMQPPRQPMLDIPTRMPAEKELDPAAGIVRGQNMALFVAGTGVAPAFQMLLSPFNPPRGFTHVFLSVRDRKDIPFERLMLFLESAGRAQFHVFVDSENKFIGPSDVPPPSKGSPPPKPIEGGDNVPQKFTSVVQQFAKAGGTGAYLPGVAQAIVCGPPGYIAYVAGDPGMNGLSSVGGLLGAKGWTIADTKRMCDL